MDEAEPNAQPQGCIGIADRGALRLGVTQLEESINQVELELHPGFKTFICTASFLYWQAQLRYFNIRCSSAKYTRYILTL